MGLVATMAIDSPLVIVFNDDWKQLTPRTGPNRAAQINHGIGFFVGLERACFLLLNFFIRKIINRNSNPAKTLWKA